MTRIVLSDKYKQQQPVLKLLGHSDAAAVADIGPQTHLPDVPEQGVLYGTIYYSV